jgi:hypothetical protein
MDHPERADSQRADRVDFDPRVRLEFRGTQLSSDGGLLVMRQIVGGRAVDAQAASASQMGRFETETLSMPENRGALADLNGHWIDRFHDRNGLRFMVSGGYAPLSFRLRGGVLERRG